MRCDTCKQEAPVVMRVVVARGYNRALTQAVYNCPSCFEKKEQIKKAGSGKSPPHRQRRGADPPSIFNEGAEEVGSQK